MALSVPTCTNLPKMPTWTDYAIYVPFWLGVARWAMFICFRVIPSLFYKQIKKIDVATLDRVVDVEDPSNVTYKTKGKKPKTIELVTKEDVTVVVTVYQPPVGFMPAMKSLAKNNPYKVLIVADITCASQVQEMLEKEGFDMSKFVVISESQPGKRVALVTGIKLSTTKLTCLVDDDAVWCDTFLEELILPFQYPTIGGVGVKQVATMKTSRWNITDVLADMRLAVRYLELRATTTVDKGCSCISGRTGCYRTFLLQTEEFYDKFLNEKFFGMQTLSGDDKFTTRWVINNGYDTYHQLYNSCKLETTFDSMSKLCVQLVRWSRNTVRSDITNLFIERKIWRRHPFTALLLFDKFLTPFVLLYGPVLLIVFFVTKGPSVEVAVGLIAWLMFSRALRICYHLYEKPHHILYIPVFIVFQYFQAFVKIYAMLTLYNRSWGTRNVTVGKGNVVTRS